MIRGRTLLILILGIAAAFGIGLWVFQGEDAENADDVREGAKVDVSVKGFTLSQGAGGHVRWELRAENAEYLQGKGRIKVRGPEITYYSGAKSEGAQETLRVKAPWGEIHQEKEEAELWPEVDIVSKSGTVHADRLHYTGESRSLLLTGNVRIIRSEMAFNATEAVLDLATNDISATGGVSGVLYTQDIFAAAKE
ncbi:MAG: LPS export ABC transporter periplasmic protein LptC [Thermodesulfobacteriota bacterium]|nr:LPS export ABC transporter periplasmic protein LptC [Thermodesulfobacteriota bacterium]